MYIGIGPGTSGVKVILMAEWSGAASCYIAVVGSRAV